MKLIFQYMNKYAGRIAGGMSIKLLATMAELILPYILEHIIDKGLILEVNTAGYRKGLSYPNPQQAILRLQPLDFLFRGQVARNRRRIRRTQYPFHGLR